MNKPVLALALAGALVPALAAAEIFRCQGPGSAVSYQQMPCEDSALGGPAGIASEYPAPNLRERERIFEQEAAMYKRLEAERDRLTHLAAVRAASAPAAAPEAPAEPVYYPVYAVGLPALPAYRVNRWPHTRGASGIPRMNPRP